MRFKQFYSLSVTHKEIFDIIFEKYYSKGYFGDIDKKIVIEQQKNWYKCFIQLIKEKNLDELKYILLNSENKLSRDWFIEMTGIDIKYKTKEVVIEMIKSFTECSKTNIK